MLTERTAGISSVSTRTPEGSTVRRTVEPASALSTPSVVGSIVTRIGPPRYRHWAAACVRVTLTAESALAAEMPAPEWGKDLGQLNRVILPHALSLLIGGARALYAVLKLLPTQRKVVLITREPRQI